MTDTVADHPGSTLGADPAPRIAAAIRDPIPWQDFVRVVETLEETGYGALFLPEIAGREAFTTLAAIAGRTQRLRLGTGVVTAASRRIQTMAMAAATVQEVSAGRLVLGLGTGPATPGALDRLRTTVVGLRGLFAGERVETDEGSARLQAPPARAVPIWLAALGPRATRLAGEIADGVLLNWCTPERVAQAVGEVHEGARAAGRDPAEVTVAVYVRACVGVDDAAALTGLRAAAGEYAAIPAYRRQFERAGLAVEAQTAARAHHDRRPDAVPESLVRAVSLLGDAEEGRARLRSYREAGAQLPIVYPVPARDRASSLLGTIFALAPHPVLAP
ncbi:MAG: LLM class flavin-dependent oxidoreductase [Actinomycetota bacterium]